MEQAVMREIRFSGSDKRPEGAEWKETYTCLKPANGSICGATKVVWRGPFKRKEMGHIKTMWCFVCGNSSQQIKTDEEFVGKPLIIDPKEP